MAVNDFGPNRLLVIPLVSSVGLARRQSNKEGDSSW